jgi:peptide deformylase
VLAVAACVVVLLLLFATYAGMRDYTFNGVAFALDLSDAHQVDLLNKAVAILRVRLTADDVCLTGPDAGFALQCVVWANGDLWLNPEIRESSAELSSGYESSSFAADDTPRLVERSDELIIRFNDTLEQKIRGANAHCIGHALEIFHMGSAILPR